MYLWEQTSSSKHNETFKHLCDLLWNERINIWIIVESLRKKKQKRFSPFLSYYRKDV